MLRRQRKLCIILIASDPVCLSLPPPLSKLSWMERNLGTLSLVQEIVTKMVRMLMHTPSLFPSILSLLRSCHNYCRTVRGRQVCKQEAARATHIFALSHITKLQCLSERTLKKLGSFSSMYLPFPFEILKSIFSHFKIIFGTDNLQTTEHFLAAASAACRSNLWDIPLCKGRYGGGRIGR